MEILRNGVSYFEEPLLNWTLRGVIWALANEAERHGYIPPVPKLSEKLTSVFQTRSPNAPGYSSAFGLG